MNKWDLRFIELAKHIAGWSKDPSTQVGAVIVNEQRIIVGTGYNGFPRGVQDTEWRLHNRDVKYRYVVHAEVNAILNSAADVRGSTLYLWPFGPPCHECMKIVVQSGISRVVYPRGDEERNERWKDSFTTSFFIASEADVVLEEIDYEQQFSSVQEAPLST